MRDKQGSFATTHAIEISPVTLVRYCWCHFFIRSERSCKAGDPQIPIPHLLYVPILVKAWGFGLDNGLIGFCQAATQRTVREIYPVTTMCPIRSSMNLECASSFHSSAPLLWASLTRIEFLVGKSSIHAEPCVQAQYVSVVSQTRQRSLHIYSWLYARVVDR